MNTTNADDLELRTLHRLASFARAAVARVRWRAEMQRRAMRVSAVVRNLQYWSLETDARRVKVAGGWAFISTTSGATLVTIDTRVAGKNIAEVAEPVTVRVHVAEFVDTGELQRLAREGLIHLVDGGSP
jgi:hypothetical protein